MPGPTDRNGNWTLKTVRADIWVGILKIGAVDFSMETELWTGWIFYPDRAATQCGPFRSATLAGNYIYRQRMP